MMGQAVATTHYLWDNPAVVQGVIVLGGNLLLGVGALGGVLLTTNNTRKVETEKRDHLDAGTRRQVRALLKRLTGIMLAGLQSGDLSAKRWNAAYYAVRDRLMERDVPTALNDALAESIYDALEVIRAARWSCLSIEEAWKAEVDEAIREGAAEPEEMLGYWSDQRKREMREVYTGACFALATVWERFDDKETMARITSSIDAHRRSETPHKC